MYFEIERERPRYDRCTQRRKCNKQGTTGVIRGENTTNKGCLRYLKLLKQHERYGWYVYSVNYSKWCTIKVLRR